MERFFCLLVAGLSREDHASSLSPLGASPLLSYAELIPCSGSAAAGSTSALWCGQKRIPQHPSLTFCCFRNCPASSGAELRFVWGMELMKPQAILSFVLIFLLTVSAQTVDAHTFFFFFLVVFSDSVTLRHDAGRLSVCQPPPNNSKQLLNCWSLARFDRSGILGDVTFP